MSIASEIQAQHPITPPPELVQQWVSEFYGTPIAPGEAAIDIATQAARWGADQEVGACCQWLSVQGYALVAAKFRAARRPKPPSLKEQALEQLDSLHSDLKLHGMGTNTDTIRRALEQLP